MSFKSETLVKKKHLNTLLSLSRKQGSRHSTCLDVARDVSIVIIVTFKICKNNHHSLDLIKY